MQVNCIIVTGLYQSNTFDCGLYLLHFVSNFCNQLQTSCCGRFVHLWKSVDFWRYFDISELERPIEGLNVVS